MAASIVSIDSVRLLTQMLQSALDEVSFLLQPDPQCMEASRSHIVGQA